MAQFPHHPLGWKDANKATNQLKIAGSQLFSPLLLIGPMTLLLVGPSELTVAQETAVFHFS